MARAHVRLQLRWGDQDAYGHVNNVAFARLLEEARIRVLWMGAGEEATGLEEHFRGDDPGGLKTLVASQTIEFLRVLEYSEHPVIVEVWIGRLGGASLDIHYEVLDGSTAERTVVARAITVTVIVDGVSMRPQRLSQEGRTVVENWMDEPLKLGRA